MKPSEKFAIKLISAATEIAAKSPRPFGRARQLAARTMRHWCPALSFARIARAIGYNDHSTAIFAYYKLERSKDENIKAQAAFMDEFVRNECTGLVREINTSTMANWGFKNAA